MDVPDRGSPETTTTGAPYRERRSNRWMKPSKSTPVPEKIAL